MDGSLSTSSTQMIIKFRQTSSKILTTDEHVCIYIWYTSWVEVFEFKVNLEGMLWVCPFKVRLESFSMRTSTSISQQNFDNTLWAIYDIIFCDGFMNKHLSSHKQVFDSDFGVINNR